MKRRIGPLIDDSAFRSVASDLGPLVVVDAGARGAPFPPITRLNPDRLALIRIEPDQEAPIEGKADFVLREALWSREETLELHLTHQPECSSVFPPAAHLVAGLAPTIGPVARQVVGRTEIRGVGLDAVVHEGTVPPVDMIKLDIHGAEYEALAGATNQLTESCVAVLVECWPVRMHYGQASFSCVHQLLEKAGFMLADAEVARWPRMSMQGYVYSRGQTVQMELLYLLDGLDPSSRITKPRLLKLIGVAELFGHVALAAQFSEVGLAVKSLNLHEAEVVQRGLFERHRAGPIRRLRSRVAGRLARTLGGFTEPYAGPR